MIELSIDGEPYKADRPIESFPDAVAIYRQHLIAGHPDSRARIIHDGLIHDISLKPGWNMRQLP